MGENLIPNIEKFVLDDRFAGVVSIKNIKEISWADLARLIKDQGAINSLELSTEYHILCTSTP
jgi:hypothetical protein